LAIWRKTSIRSPHLVNIGARIGTSKTPKLFSDWATNTIGIDFERFSALIMLFKFWPDNRLAIDRKEPGTQSQLRNLTYPVVGRMKMQKIMRYLFALALLLGVMVSSGMSNLSTVQAGDDDRYRRDRRWDHRRDRDHDRDRDHRRWRDNNRRYNDSWRWRRNYRNNRYYNNRYYNNSNYWNRRYYRRY
jgi:hypothetical protein